MKLVSIRGLLGHPLSFGLKLVMKPAGGAAVGTDTHNLGAVQNQNHAGEPRERPGCKACPENASIGETQRKAGGCREGRGRAGLGKYLPCAMSLTYILSYSP